MASDILYHRLGGYDAVVAVVDDLLARLKADAQLGRFWHTSRAVSANVTGNADRENGGRFRSLEHSPEAV